MWWGEEDDVARSRSNSEFLNSDFGQTFFDTMMSRSSTTTHRHLLFTIVQEPNGWRTDGDVKCCCGLENAMFLRHSSLTFSARWSVWCVVVLLWRLMEVVGGCCCWLCCLVPYAKMISMSTLSKVWFDRLKRNEQEILWYYLKETLTLGMTGLSGRW